MTRPRGSERGVDAPFLKIDLGAAFDTLKSEEAWSARPRNSATLFKYPGLRGVLVGLHKGATIEKHRAEGPTSVHLLSGALSMTVGGESIALEPGQMLAMEPGLEHSVHASEESAFLLTIGSG